MFNVKNRKLMSFKASITTKAVIKLCNQLVDVVYCEVYVSTKIYNNAI